MKIWLDDTRRAPRDFIHVHNLTELSVLLKCRGDEIEVMDFDYDLGRGFANGYDAAKYIFEEYPARWPKAVKAHSSSRDANKLIMEFDAEVREKLYGGSQH